MRLLESWARYSANLAKLEYSVEMIEMLRLAYYAGATAAADAILEEDSDIDEICIEIDRHEDSLNGYH